MSTINKEAPRKFAVVTSPKGAKRTLMCRQDYNSGIPAIFICGGEDATGQLIDNGFICYLDEWANKQLPIFRKAGITVELLEG